MALPSLKLKTAALKENQAIHIPKFLTKTFDLLEGRNYPHAIEWYNKGSSILIKNSLEFEKILPRFFKHKKIASFIRQLNLYGFKKVKNNQNQFIYYNPKFQSGKRNLLKMMKRKTETSSLTFENESEDTEELELADENRELKKLHKEAAIRINTLETKLKEIAEQNLLLAEIAMKKENEIIQLKNKIAFRCCEESVVSNKSAQSNDSCTPVQKAFQPKGAFRPIVKSLSPSLVSSNGDQKASPKLNVVKTIIVKPSRDYEESDSDRKSEDSIVRKPYVEYDREIPAAAATHNYLTLFTQTIADSSGLKPMFRFKIDSSTEKSSKVSMN
jgi:hypothetical protein